MPAEPAPIQPIGPWRLRRCLEAALRQLRLPQCTTPGCGEDAWLCDACWRRLSDRIADVGTAVQIPGRRAAVLLLLLGIEAAERELFGGPL